MIEAIFKGHEFNKVLIDFMNTIVEKEGKVKHAYEQASLSVRCKQTCNQMP